MFLQNYYTIVYAISLTLIMGGFKGNRTKEKKKRFLALRSVLSLGSIFLIEQIPVPYESYIVLLFVPALWVCFYEKRKKLEILQQSLNAVLFLFIIIVLFGSPILFWKLEMRETLVFQVSMGILALLSSSLYALYLRRTTNHSIKSRKGSLCVAIAKCLILVFFSWVVPQFHIDNLELFYLSQWCFAVLLLFVIFLLRLYSRLEQSYLLLQVDRKRQKEIEKEYKNMLGLKHYLIHLIEGFLPYFKRSDIIGATAYFERYISPIHEEYLKTDDLKNINNILLSSLMENAINQSIHKKIHLDYFICGQIEIERSLEMDVFRILSEWVSNAVEALQKQERGRLNIEMKNKKDCTSFTISNTVYPVALNQTRSTQKGRGHGLAINEELIIKNRRLTSVHEVRNGYYHHCLLVHRR